MVVYWDLVALWNFALDYLLLLGTARLAGMAVHRRRLAAGAALGAVYAVAALALPISRWASAAALALMCLAAFGKERYIKLTLLFLLIACALGGGTVLLGRMSGGMARLTRGVVYAELPWGVFCGAAGISWVLLAVVFRGGARHSARDFVRACVACGGKTVTVTLLRDTGNLLTDPLTGEGVPVIEASALAPLGRAPTATLRAHTVSGGETALPALRCDALTVDGRACGARLIAVSPDTFGGRFQGLWYDERVEEAKRRELEAVVG